MPGLYLSEIIRVSADLGTLTLKIQEIEAYGGVKIGGIMDPNVWFAYVLT